MSPQASKPTLASDAGVPHIQAVEKVETAKVATKAATPADGQHDYRVYKPTGTARTFAGRETIFYSQGDQAMYGVIDRYLRSINWIQLISWRNDTDAAQQYQYSYTTGLTITQGSEVTNGFNLGASYKGMSIGIDHSTRTFKSTETTTTQTTTITVNVPPRSVVYFYQKRFDFEDNITFINDAWGSEWNIGPWGGYSPLTTKITSVQIMAEEYYTKSQALPEGPGSVTVDSVAAASKASITRKRENVTQRAKDKLDSMGL
ncbi:hypothetical protein ONZ43_g2508 [Nemania bipapillata]|uniref:Uncharacterized protein n=1 Tax=Nemania bipapillata TaxID=110536 RepID=A0ACC2J0Q4_9PEZI|nr:hypothetical protein ONZ43_g2508 [Nemania bipapillata]